MRCEKCKYTTKTTCQCHFGYEQASKEFVDGNCEKFIDKYKEEYTPIIAREIFEEIENIFIDGCEVYHTMEPEDFAEFKKKYIGE